MFEHNGCHGIWGCLVRGILDWYGQDNLNVCKYGGPFLENQNLVEFRLIAITPDNVTKCYAG